MKTTIAIFVALLALQGIAGIVVGSTAARVFSASGWNVIADALK
jgi:hypothetical protein